MKLMYQRGKITRLIVMAIFTEKAQGSYKGKFNVESYQQNKTLYCPFVDAFSSEVEILVT